VEVEVVRHDGCPQDAQGYIQLVRIAKQPRIRDQEALPTKKKQIITIIIIIITIILLIIIMTVAPRMPRAIYSWWGPGIDRGPGSGCPAKRGGDKDTLSGAQTFIIVRPSSQSSSSSS
jgi:hypothetical protein